MKTVVFLAAMIEELEAVLDEFSSYPKVLETFKTITFHIMTVGDIRLICALSGCGKVNAAMTVCVSIFQYHPDFVINVGVAGGFRPDQQVLDLVVATEFVYTDVDIVCLGFLPGQLLGMPQVYPVNSFLLSIIKDLEKENLLPAKVHYGRIGSSDAFISKQSQVDHISSVFPEVICVEMEGAAIAHVCHLFQTPLLSLRSLSDIAVLEHDNSIQFEETLMVATERAAKLAKVLVERLSSNDR